MMHLRTIFVAIFTILLAAPASAVSYNASIYFDPSAASANQTVTLHASLAVSADSSYYIQQLFFSSLSPDITIDWGDGTSLSDYLNTLYPTSYQPTDYTFNWQYTHVYSSALPSNQVYTARATISGGVVECEIAASSTCSTTPVSATPLATINISPAATPLPSSLLLFVSGFGVMGLLGWGVKRKMATPIVPA